jgi:hypothetical protein
MFMKTVTISRYKNLFLRSFCKRMLELANSMVSKLTYYLEMSHINIYNIKVHMLCF